MAISNGSVSVYYNSWINPPHDKIAVCICDQRSWVFWFNSLPRQHGYGQLLCDPSDHPAALVRPCTLDLSSVKFISPSERAAVQDRGIISPAFRNKILAALANSIRTLPDKQ
jgi:hypothetical protein